MTSLHYPQPRSKEESGGERLGGPQSPPLNHKNPFVRGPFLRNTRSLYHESESLQEPYSCEEDQKDTWIQIGDALISALRKMTED